MKISKNGFYKIGFRYLYEEIRSDRKRRTLMKQVIDLIQFNYWEEQTGFNSLHWIEHSFSDFDCRSLTLRLTFSCVRYCSTHPLSH